MGKKKAVNLYVDPKLVKEVRELGGQPSKIFERALKEFISKNKPKNCRADDTQNCEGNAFSDVKQSNSCRRVSGRLPGESLRKLRPSSRSAGSKEHGRETGQWHRNDTSRLARGCGDAEVVPAGMKRPIRGMQGQIAAEERLLKAGGSPLSSMSSENRRRVTTDSPAQLQTDDVSFSHGNFSKCTAKNCIDKISKLKLR